MKSNNRVAHALELPLDTMLFGGSFDPPHLVHLMMARYVLENGIARSLNFVPAAVSPFKMDEPPASPEDRMSMLKQGIGELLPDISSERLQIIEIEVKRPPPSYTYETCEEMRELNPQSTIGLLLGSDSFPHFHRWKEMHSILTHHPIVVFMRPGDDRDEIMKYAGWLKKQEGLQDASILVLDNPHLDCASTDLKMHLSAGDTDAVEKSRCLPDSIYRYIQSRSLYQKKERSQ